MSNAFDLFALFVSFVVTILYLCESLGASPFLFSADTAKSLVSSG